MAHAFAADRPSGQPGGVAATAMNAIPRWMSDAPPSLDRIERALARIEAAATRRAFAVDAMKRRHEKLRANVSEAIEALDEMIAREERKGG